MEREIKFRAWNKLNNKLICEGFHVFGEITIFGLIEAYFDDYYKENNIIPEYSLSFLNDFIIEQYIGVQDKNKIDIYEGDIVIVNDTLTKGIIKFINGSFVIDVFESDAVIPIRIIYDEYNQLIEVVSNIHENKIDNPDLLK